MPPKFLYFDIGNVLLSFSHEQMCQQMADVAGVTRQAVWDILFTNREAASIEKQFETGQLSADQFFDYFCRATGTRPDQRELEEAVCDIFAPVDRMEEIVRRLTHAGHRLGILSNTNSLQWHYMSSGRFPLLAPPPGDSRNPFLWAVLSYEVGSMKPDPRIYEVAIERAGVPACEVFFVDDRDDNVAGALAAGIDAVQFHGVQQLIEDLTSRGISGI